MLFVLAATPVVVMADKKEKKDKCNKAIDKDCDGAPGCTKSVCKAGDDWDDDDPDVGGVKTPVQRPI